MTKETFVYGLNACAVTYHNGQKLYEHDELVKCFEDLGIFEQEPKMGHWIVSEWKDEIYTNVATCSLCDAEVTNNGADKFCPNCGCRMIKPQERSDEECMKH